MALVRGTRHTGVAQHEVDRGSGTLLNNEVRYQRRIGLRTRSARPGRYSDRSSGDAGEKAATSSNLPWEQPRRSYGRIAAAACIAEPGLVIGQDAGNRTAPGP